MKIIVTSIVLAIVLALIFSLPVLAQENGTITIIMTPVGDDLR
jgi:biotin transporter BioY